MKGKTMNNPFKYITIVIFISSLALCPFVNADDPPPPSEQDWYFDQEGFRANQNNQFGIGEESINLFNGNLTLSYVDLRIPGNCGNDLVIQRVYNSKIHKWEGLWPVKIKSSWVGLGSFFEIH